MTHDPHSSKEDRDLKKKSDEAIESTSSNKDDPVPDEEMEHVRSSLRRPFWWLLFAVLIVLLSSWTAWFPALFPAAGDLTGFAKSEDVQRLASRLEQLKGRGNSPSKVLQHQHKEWPQFQASLTHIEQKMKMLEEKLSQISHHVDQAKDLGEGNTSHLDQEITLLKDDLHQLKTHLKGALDETHTKIALILRQLWLFSELEKRLDDGKPYQDQLEAFGALVPEHSSFKTLLSDLSAYQQLGVPAPHVLIKEVRHILEILKNTPQDSDKVGTVVSEVKGLFNHLKNLVKVRRVEEKGASLTPQVAKWQELSDLIQKRQWGQAVTLIDAVLDLNEDQKRLKEHLIARKNIEGHFLTLKTAFFKEYVASYLKDTPLNSDQEALMKEDGK